MRAGRACAVVRAPVVGLGSAPGDDDDHACGARQVLIYYLCSLYNIVVLGRVNTSWAELNSTTCVGQRDGRALR